MADETLSTMLKKVKEKISDEVNSAATKLQNIQIIDQLASSVADQNSNLSQNEIHFSLIDDDNPIIDHRHDEKYDEKEPDLPLIPHNQLFEDRIADSQSQSISPSSSSLGDHLDNHNQLQTTSQANDNNHIKLDKNDDHLLQTCSRTTQQQSSRTTPSSSNNNKQLLLAKFKESIKSKNSQIQSLKESLKEIDIHKEHCDRLKTELEEVKKSHEKWTVSVAESKQVMHLELERKNVEIIKLKNDINNLQTKIHECNSIIRQLRANIQDLESKLVSTCAAHQKERETLTRDLTIARNNAIRQVQREHEISVEKIKLDLEKSIEALKMGLLTKDQQLMERAQVQQQLAQQNCELKVRLELLTNQCDSQSKELEELRAQQSTQQQQLESEQIPDKPEMGVEVEVQVGETIECRDSETMTDIEVQPQPEQPQTPNDSDGSKDVELEYLRNIIYKFMLGQEPVILARVIGTILKFDQAQTDQVCAVQEAIHSITKQ